MVLETLMYACNRVPQMIKDSLYSHTNRPSLQHKSAGNGSTPPSTSAPPTSPLPPPQEWGLGDHVVRNLHATTDTSLPHCHNLSQSGCSYGFTTCVVGSLTKYQASYAKLFICVPIVLPWSQFSCKRPCHAGSNPLITHRRSSRAAGRVQVP